MEKVKAVIERSETFRTGPVPPTFGAPTTRSADLPTPTTTPNPSWVAPGSSIPAPPQRPQPADPTAVLDELVATVVGVDSALLASVDGFGIARSSSMSDEASHPAMLAAAVGLAHQLAAMGGGSKLRQLVVEHDAGLLVVWPAGAERVLAVLATSTVEQRRLRLFVQGHMNVLVGASS
ncbi:MAG: roadblock/LC7 domain-containing protein [Ilumatobacteraceae bacterium]